MNGRNLERINCQRCVYTNLVEVVDDDVEVGLRTPPMALVASPITLVKPPRRPPLPVLELVVVAVPAAVELVEEVSSSPLLERTD